MVEHEDYTPEDPDDEVVFSFELTRDEVEDMLQDGTYFDEDSFHGLDEILYDRAWSWVLDNIGGGR